MILNGQISIRKLMAAVLGVAVFLWLTIPAVVVYRTSEPHVHTGIDLSGTPTLSGWSGIEPPFWPRYVRCLTGRSWKKHPDCGFVTGFLADRCEFAYSDMVLKIGGRSLINFDSDQDAKLEAILRSNDLH